MHLSTTIAACEFEFVTRNGSTVAVTDLARLRELAARTDHTLTAEDEGFLRDAQDVVGAAASPGDGK